MTTDHTKTNAQLILELAVARQRLSGLEADVEEWKKTEEDVKKSFQNLEIIVKHRTTALSVANLKLKREITERKQAEEALRQSEARYALAQRAARIGTWEWDIANDSLYWSEMIEPLFGFEPGQFGRTNEAFMECVHPEERQLVVDSVEACLKGDKEYAVEHRIVRPDGRIRWMAETGDVQRDESGQPLRMHGVVQDITERKELDELREDMERVMRHDLKTPLNGLMGLPEILLEDNNLTEKQIEMLELMEETGQAMVAQIDQSLDLLKMERGRFEFVPEEVDVPGVIARVRQDLASLAVGKGVRLELQVEDGTQGNNSCFTALALGRLTYTMVANVVRNAVEASPDGVDVAIHIRDGDSLTITVRNKGAVPEEIRERFFEKYVTVGKTKGTGLGTYSAKLMAEAQHGSIQLDSSEEGWTTVVMSLPGCSKT
jgi:PAS domain S-box-containing protein